MKLSRWVISAALLFWGSAAFAQPRSTSSQWMNLIRDRVEQSDWLGARILIRKVENRNLPIADWYQIRGIVFRHPEIGVDLILRGDRNYVKPEPPNTEFNLNASLMQADQELLQKNFQEAFQSYQKIAQKLRPKLALTKEPATEANFTYPYVLQGMARALFGAKRLRDAWTVYTWIPAKYPKFRQVLFERMWTSFKAGWVDLALGSIASQRSVYFSKYLEPESYLIQIYLFKTLCREEDLNSVLREIADFKWRLEHGNLTLEEWSHSDLDTRVLYELAESPIREGTPGASIVDRKNEQRAIHGILDHLFASAKRRLLDDLGVAQAYSNLAVVPGLDTGLKPIEKLPSRAALMAANLEIWPAERTEEWADEIGFHRFIGESLCQKH